MGSQRVGHHWATELNWYLPYRADMRDRNDCKFLSMEELIKFLIFRDKCQSFLCVLESCSISNSIANSMHSSIMWHWTQGWRRRCVHLKLKKNSPLFFLPFRNEPSISYLLSEQAPSSLVVTAGMGANVWMFPILELRKDIFTYSWALTWLKWLFIDPLWASLVVQRLKRLPAMRETWVRSMGWEDPLEKEMATHSSILPGESHGRRILVGYSPRGHKESDTTERLYFHFSLYFQTHFILV